MSANLVEVDTMAPFPICFCFLFSFLNGAAGAVPEPMQYFPDGTVVSGSLRLKALVIKQGFLYRNPPESETPAEEDAEEALRRHQALEVRFVQVGEVFFPRLLDTESGGAELTQDGWVYVVDQQGNEGWFDRELVRLWDGVAVRLAPESMADHLRGQLRSPLPEQPQSPQQEQLPNILREQTRSILRERFLSLHLIAEEDASSGPVTKETDHANGMRDANVGEGATTESTPLRPPQLVLPVFPIPEKDNHRELHLGNREFLYFRRGYREDDFKTLPEVVVMFQPHQTIEPYLRAMNEAMLLDEIEHQTIKIAWYPIGRTLESYILEPGNWTEPWLFRAFVRDLRFHKENGSFEPDGFVDLYQPLYRVVTDIFSPAEPQLPRPFSHLLILAQHPVQRPETARKVNPVGLPQILAVMARKGISAEVFQLPSDRGSASEKDALATFAIARDKAWRTEQEDSDFSRGLPSQYDVVSDDAATKKLLRERWRRLIEQAKDRRPRGYGLLSVLDDSVKNPSTDSPQGAIQAAQAWPAKNSDQLDYGFFVSDTELNLLLGLVYQQLTGSESPPSFAETNFSAHGLLQSLLTCSSSRSSKPMGGDELTPLDRDTLEGLRVWLSDALNRSRRIGKGFVFLSCADRPSSD